MKYIDREGYHNTSPEPRSLDDLTIANAIQYMAGNGLYTVDDLPDGRKLMRFREVAFISKG